MPLQQTYETPKYSFWHEYDLTGACNLKTQKDFIQCVQNNIHYNAINQKTYELLSHINLLKFMVYDIRLDLTLNIRKRDLFQLLFTLLLWKPLILTTLLVSSFILTSSSFTFGFGASVFCDLFSFYLHVDSHTAYFDGEVEAIHLDPQQLSVNLSPS